MKLRPIALLALTLGASLAATSCSSMNRDAARVNGTAITVDQIDEAAAALKSAHAAAINDAPNQAEPSLLIQTYGDTPGSNADVARLVLLVQVYSNALGITADERSAVEQQLDQNQLAALPSEVRRAVVNQSAVIARITQDDAAASDTVKAADVWINPAFGSWSGDVQILSLADDALAGG